MTEPSHIGRYQVVRPLGHGGMGRVFLAEDPTLERRVALKLLHRDPTSTGLREEAKALAALRHPSIITIYEIGDHDGQDFIAMEYLPGRTLRQLLEDGGARAALLEICAKVALAVEAAHHAGILHRDIKPENILVGDTGEVKVVDFGIARRLGRRPHRAATAQEFVDALQATMPISMGTDTIVSEGTQTVYGTPAYMAPETLSGEASTEASDVYGLGVVLHECLAGRRPYAASSLVEMIALVVDGAPPRLDDPLADLVEQMLAPAPADRPSLADVVVRLRPRRAATPVVTRPDRRWLIAVLAGALVLAVGFATWRYVREPEPATNAAVTAPIVARIAIAPIVVDVLSYGAEKPSADNMADALAQTLAKVKGAQLTGIALKGQPNAELATAARLGAQYLVTARVSEASGVLHAHAQVIEVAGGRRAAFDLSAPAPLLSPLIDELTIKLARMIAPEANFDRTPDRMLAERFYQQGKPLLDASRFPLAWTYLEQAVDVDPTFFEGWFALTLVLAWQDAPEEVVAHATQEALRLAPPGRKHDLMQGVALFLDGRYEDARLALERLDTAGVDDRRELFYFLGEVNWHDGRHDAAYRYFERALEADREFRPATIHMSQYTLARRDDSASRFLVGISGENFEAIAFGAGNYKQIAATGSPGFQVPARLVLDLPVSAELAEAAFGHGIERSCLEIARALEAGDRGRARAEFATIWAREITGRDLPSHVYYSLELLGELVIAGGLVDETRTLVTLLAQQSTARPRRGYHRLSILAAPLLADASLIPGDGLTYRNHRLAAAMVAELAGDRATAAEILTELVRDPTFTWDYPERAALLRNLRALRKPKQVAALCDDTMRPPVFRLAFLVLRGDCARPIPRR